jgi:hypothetical protein
LVGVREAAFMEYWPFREDARRSAVNQEAEKFALNSFGSPNRNRTYDLPVDRRMI